MRLLTRSISYLLTATIGVLVGLQLSSNDSLTLPPQSCSSVCPSLAQDISNDESRNDELVKAAKSLSTIGLAESLQITQSLLVGDSENIVLDNNSQELVKQLIDKSTDEEISQTLNLFFDETELLGQIEEPRDFARRLLEEMKTQDTPADERSHAQLYFSLDAAFPNSPMNFFQIDKNEKIFAHIDVLGGLGTSDNKFFIKWVNLTSGEMLLYKQKKIDPVSDQNWVSFKPDSKWENGTYEVSFYQFNSSLNKLASNSFQVSVEN